MDEKSQDLGELLASNYLLASLNVRIWSGKKTDKTATQELLADKGAIANAASVVKSLLAGNDAKLKECAAAFTRIRSFFYERSSPWTTSSIGAMKGDRLISTATSITFLGEFAKLKVEADVALTEFIAEYDSAVKSAAVSLGTLYDATQYPSKAAIATMFDANMELRPVPETADFDRLTNVPAHLATGLKDLYEKQTRRQMDNALSDVQKRLLSELERMDTQLSKVAKGEKTRLFKSMTGNLKHLVGMARSLNFVGNAEIDEIADTIETNLLKYEVDAYKDNATLARHSAAVARKVLEKVNEDSNWTVTNEVQVLVTPSIVDVVPQVVESIEPEFTNPEPIDEPVNEQLDEDQEFLASLMTKVMDPTADEDPPVEVEEPEDTDAVSEPTPDFDDDEFMFKS